MIKLPQYTKRDSLIFSALMPVFVILLNYLLFGNRYFLEPWLFIAAGIITFTVMAASWMAHTWVAVTLRNRFSKDEQMLQRLVLAIGLFIIMTGITLTILFWGYDYFRFMNYEINEARYNWALLAGVLLNVFTTVVHECVYSFEKWKLNITVTEQLKKEYMQSQLIGLRNHLSPHFLFNSLNSLSSLIHENTASAEQFLNEMSKVYRYLLRNNEEKTVELGTELQFVRSYYHLLKTRYGRGLMLTIEIGDNDRRKLLPPLTLQILLDAILKTNLISKDSPLTLDLSVNEDGHLEIRFNIQKKISGDLFEDNSGIEHISNKFRLLCNNTIGIHENGNFRIMKVPLLVAEQNPVT